MADKPLSDALTPANHSTHAPSVVPPGALNAPATAGVPRRSPGHRGADMRDTVAEMAERAQLISQEAGSKVAAAMKDVISAAAGIAGFAIESARDLVQYMVRRGQMTPEEAEKLMREAEAAYERRPASEKGRPTATKVAADRAIAAKAEAAARLADLAASQPLPPRHTPQARPAVSPAVVPAVAAEAKPISKPAAAKTPAKTAKAAAPAKPKPTAKPAAKVAKPVSKAAPAKASGPKSAKPAPKKKPKG